MRIHLVFVYEVNWDEFLNLSMVYDFWRGDLAEVFQTAFVHGFHWVSYISENEVDQIVAARLVMTACGLTTLIFLFLIVRNLIGTGPALFSALCYCGFSFVILQGSSFRTDTIALSMVMVAFWLTACRPVSAGNSVLSGVLIGVSGMITIKAIFHVPTLAALLMLRFLDRGRFATVVWHGCLTGFAALLAFLLVYLLHWLSIDAPVSGIAFLERTTEKTIGEHNFDQAIVTFVASLVQNPVFWLALCFGAGVAGWRVVGSGSGERKRWGTLLASVLPLASLLVYTETYVYYYPFMLAPPAMLCGAALGCVRKRSADAILATASVAIGVLAFATYSGAIARDNRYQRLTVETVHRMFPEPVPYIDRCSMISAYPKHGLFMSAWGMTDYYRAGEPVMRQLLEGARPKFLVANRHMLDLDRLGPGEHGPAHVGLFKEDVSVLRENYVRHWGAIYVAGKQVGFRTPGQAHTLRILIEGVYTLEGPGALQIGGRLIAPGETVRLDRGPVNFSARDAAGTYTLRWGENLYHPAQPAPQGKLFTGF